MPVTEPSEKYLQWLSSGYASNPEKVVIGTVIGQPITDITSGPRTAAEFAAVVNLVESSDIRHWFGTLSSINDEWWAAIAWWDKVVDCLDNDEPDWRDGKETSAKTCSELIVSIRARRSLTIAVDITTVDHFPTRRYTTSGHNVVAVIPIDETRPDPTIWFDRAVRTNPTLVDRVVATTALDDYPADVLVSADAINEIMWASWVPVLWRRTARGDESTTAIITPDSGPLKRTPTS